MIQLLKQFLGWSYEVLRGARMVSRFGRLQSAGVVTVGRHSYGVPDVHTFRGNRSQLHIGAFTSIADGVTILLGGNHPTRWVSSFALRARLHLPGAYHDGMPSSKGDVVIGSDVWIGQGAMVLSGVTIGDGAIVGAGAVVVSDIPPYAIGFGIPARVAGYRFDPPTVAELLAAGWWNWPLSRIVAAVDLLSSERVAEFLQLARTESGVTLP
jgi:acetyltransferase-like isoleucine patch superfamily enzyme